jgi:hypothetical protein
VRVDPAKASTELSDTDQLLSEDSNPSPTQVFRVTILNRDHFQNISCQPEYAHLSHEVDPFRPITQGWRSSLSAWY